MSKSNSIYFNKSMLKSNIFKGLSGAAVHILIGIRLKCQTTPPQGRSKYKLEEWDVSNNGEIVYPYAQIKKDFGYSKTTISKALKELIDKGFIKIEPQNKGGIPYDRTNPKGAANKFTWVRQGWQEIEEKQRTKKQDTSFKPDKQKGTKGKLDQWDKTQEKNKLEAWKHVNESFKPEKQEGIKGDRE